jgi:hypothetical protein
MSKRDQLRQGGGILCQPMRNIPYGVRPIPFAIARDIECSPGLPGRHEPLGRGGKFSPTRRRLGRQKDRIVEPWFARKFGIKDPTAQAQTVFNRRCRVTDSYRIPRLAQHRPALATDMVLQAGDHVIARGNVPGIHLRQKKIQQIFTLVNFRLKTRAAGFGLKFQLPVWPGKIAALRRIFGIRPAEPGVHHIAHCQPEPGGFAKGCRWMRIVAERTLARENRARQGDVHFQPARMCMSCNIVFWPCRCRYSGPQCLNKQPKRQINLPPRDQFARVERLNIDIALCKGQKAKPVFALERKHRDGTSEAIRPTMQNFWSRVAHNLNLCPCDVFHHDRRIHVISQGTIDISPPALPVRGGIVVLMRKSA